jgi:hypothetical protein
MDFPEIAEALLLSEGAIRNHIKEYQSYKKYILRAVAVWPYLIFLLPEHGFSR